MINSKRSKNLVPGSFLPLMPEEARVPVLLIQQNCSPDGFGCGWDLLVPADWGSSFWVSLVYNGARVGGTREASHLQLEWGDWKEFPSARIAQRGRRPPLNRPN